MEPLTSGRHTRWALSAPRPEGPSRKGATARKGERLAARFEDLLLVTAEGSETLTPTRTT